MFAQEEKPCGTEGVVEAGDSFCFLWWTHFSLLLDSVSLSASGFFSLLRTQSSHNFGPLMVLLASKKWAFFTFSSAANKFLWYFLAQSLRRGNMISLAFWEFRISCPWIRGPCLGQSNAACVGVHMDKMVAEAYPFRVISRRQRQRSWVSAVKWHLLVLLPSFSFTLQHGLDWGEANEAPKVQGSLVPYVGVILKFITLNQIF